MLKLVPYMKKYAGYVVLIIMLLFGQAYCDLALPSYTSNIVNVGIQQSGIEDAVPDKLREETAQVLMKFMSEDEKDTFTDAYELNDDKVYELKKLKKGERSELNDVMSQSILYFTMMVSGDSMDMSQNSDDMSAAVDQKKVEQAAMSIMQMPDEAISQVKEKLDTALKDLPETMKNQFSVYFVKSEYEAQGISLDDVQQHYILIAGLKMIAMAFAIVVASVLVTFLSCRLAAGFSRDLRKNVYGKVLSFSNQEFNQFSTASLITRSTNDIQQVQMVLMMLFRMVLYAPILGVGGIVKAVNTNVSMTWTIALAVIMIILLVCVLMAVAMPKFKVLQNMIDRINQVSREILTGLPVIRAFSTQKHEEERFDKANHDLMKTNLFVNRCMTFMMPAMMFIMNGITVLIVYFGGKGIDKGTMQVGDMMAFIQYAMQIIMSFLMITMMSIMLPRASVSAKRINEILTTSQSILDPEKPVIPAKGQKVTLEFDHVNFAYDGAEENILNDISFVADSGKTTAFIGSTGSGKSTLVNLIPRFYDVTGGAIRINGVNIKDYSLRDHHEMIGYVPQKGVLFSGTIESNILYGCKDGTEETAKEAARIAQATEFIEEKADTYQSEIAQGGTNVSGGQKQRLSIARAIAKNPDIYIFDDSFSALDYKTDVELRHELSKKTKNAVTLIVAQRISTILHADQIIVLDEGNIAGIGTHKELLKNCEVYRQIAQSQLSKEELANE